MIYETLAAMADWLDDRRHDFQSSNVQAKTVLDDFRDGNANGVVDAVTNSGSLFIPNETLTVGNKFIMNNDKTAVLDDHITGIQGRTSRKELEDNIAPANFHISGEELIILQNNTGVSFTVTEGQFFIDSDIGNIFSVLSVASRVRVTGSGSNDGDFTVLAVTLNSTRIEVTETVSNESAGESVTITRI